MKCNTTQPRFAQFIRQQQLQHQGHRQQHPVGVVCRLALDKSALQLGRKKKGNRIAYDAIQSVRVVVKQQSAFGAVPSIELVPW